MLQNYINGGILVHVIFRKKMIRNFVRILHYVIKDPILQDKKEILSILKSVKKRRISRKNTIKSTKPLNPTKPVRPVTPPPAPAKRSSVKSQTPNSKLKSEGLKVVKNPQTPNSKLKRESLKVVKNPQTPKQQPHASIASKVSNPRSPAPVPKAKTPIRQRPSTKPSLKVQGKAGSASKLLFKKNKPDKPDDSIKEHDDEIEEDISTSVRNILLIISKAHKERSTPNQRGYKHWRYLKAHT